MTTRILSQIGKPAKSEKCGAPGMEGQPSCKSIGWLDKPFTDQCFCKWKQVGPFDKIHKALDAYNLRTGRGKAR